MQMAINSPSSLGFTALRSMIIEGRLSVVTEADEDFLYVLVFGIAAEFQCLLYDGAKILFAVLVFANVLHTVPADHICADRKSVV